VQVETSGLAGQASAGYDYLAPARPDDTGADAAGSEEAEGETQRRAPAPGLLSLSSRMFHQRNREFCYPGGAECRTCATLLCGQRRGLIAQSQACLKRSRVGHSLHVAGRVRRLCLEPVPVSAQRASAAAAGAPSAFCGVRGAQAAQAARGGPGGAPAPERRAARAPGAGGRAARAGAAGGRRRDGPRAGEPAACGRGRRVGGACVLGFYASLAFV